MSDSAAHDDHGHDHDPLLAHHFYNHKQQLDSFKLGMWLFITTEVLFFSGLFCAYAIYRSLYPELFEFGDDFLNKWLGALNTGVLIFSSLTMAWAVRSAQLGNNKSVQVLITITMVCAALFLGVKAVEYSHKWDEGLLPGKLFSYVPGAHHEEHGISKYLIYISIAPLIGLISSAGLLGVAIAKRQDWAKVLCFGLVLTFAGYFAGVGVGKLIPNESKGVVASHNGQNSHDEHKEEDHHDGEHADGEKHDKAHVDTDEHEGKEEADDGDDEEPSSKDAASVEADEPLVTAEQAVEVGDPVDAPVPSVDPPGLSSNVIANEVGAMGTSTEGIKQGIVLSKESGLEAKMPPENAGIFFSIYYCMTGLHAIHIIGGIIALAWLLAKAGASHFTPSYFGPVDCVGLYWHLVDLIWIYLFPLLYLIA